MPLLRRQPAHDLRARRRPDQGRAVLRRRRRLLQRGDLRSQRQSRPTRSIATAVTARNLERFGGYFDFDNPDNPLASHSWIVRAVLHRRRSHRQRHPRLRQRRRDRAPRPRQRASRRSTTWSPTFPDAEQVVVTGAERRLRADRPVRRRSPPTASRRRHRDVRRLVGRLPGRRRRSAAMIGTVWGTPDGDARLARDGRRRRSSGWSFPEQYIYRRPSRARRCGSDASTTPSTRCRRRTARWPASPPTSW